MLCTPQAQKNHSLGSGFLNSLFWSVSGYQHKLATPVGVGRFLLGLVLTMIDII
jgi:hypothetical protein